MHEKPTSKLKRGDVILAIQERGRWHDVPKRVEVTKYVEQYDDGTVVVEVKQDPKSVISPRRYFRFDRVRVGRWATILGKRFLKIDDDLYESADGKWTIERDYMETECEGPHPVRLTPELTKAIRATPHHFCPEAREAVEHNTYKRMGEKTKRGYLCPGGEYHAHPEWIPHYNDDPGFDHMGSWADTPSGAISRFIDEVNA